jgi:hypothetical protein
LDAARLERGDLQLNDVNPVAYIGATLKAIFNGHCPNLLIEARWMRI